MKRIDFNFFSDNISTCFAQKKGLLRLSAAYTPPPEGFVKLNFDGFKLSNVHTYYEFVIWNSNGDVLLCGANSINSSHSIIVAEAWG